MGSPMPDIDRQAAAKTLLSDSLLTEIMDQLEQDYIDRIKYGDSEDDRLRQDMATALRVIQDFRDTLEQYADGAATEQVSDLPGTRWV